MYTVVNLVLFKLLDFHGTFLRLVFANTPLTSGFVLCRLIFKQNVCKRNMLFISPVPISHKQKSASTAQQMNQHRDLQLCIFQLILSCRAKTCLLLPLFELAQFSFKLVSCLPVLSILANNVTVFFCNSHGYRQHL